MSNTNSRATWEPWELESFNGPSQAKASITTIGKVAAPADAEVDGTRSRESEGQKGFQAGYDAGHAEGLLAGTEQAQKIEGELANQLGQIISRFDSGIAELEHAVGNELLALALEIARKITHQTVKLRPEIILDVIHEALGQLPALHATIHLNPLDAARVRQTTDDHLTRGGHRILDDSSLERGDVVIEAGGTNLDARLATRWQRVTAALDQDTSWLAEDAPEQP
ncbi:MAG: flagellar assembly protein FliH [Burkholderiaceae bacterium]|nr:flagellar assembly protein FliH [Sulfuritalea sp.]MCF8174116.1 flagellar assembly protein FliH [Burkholderiaceae bacterium]MCF8184414.1 flagellar assembly protein FliH [Polynucleobacter sp.]